MKLSIEQLPQQLKKQLASCYLLSSDEPLLLQEAQHLIVKHVQTLNYQVEPMQTVDAQFSWSNFLADSSSLSLFSQQRLLRLRFNDAKFNDAAQRALNSYLKQAQPDCCLLIVMPKLEAKTQQTAWFKNFEQQTAVVQLWPPTPAQLPAWIQQRLQRVGLQADRDTAHCLADYVAGNLLAAAQEIEKLSLIYAKGPLTRAQITAAVADQAQFDVFTWIDAALQGHATQVVRIQQNLQQTGTEPVIILWALARELRSLVTIAQQITLGKSLEQALQHAKVWDKRKPLLNSALRRHTVHSLLKLLQTAAQLDQIVKGFAPGHAWNSLLQLGLSLAGKAPLSITL